MHSWDREQSQKKTTLLLDHPKKEIPLINRSGSQLAILDIHRVTLYKLDRFVLPLLPTLLGLLLTHRLVRQPPRIHIERIKRLCPERTRQVRDRPERAFDLDRRVQRRVQ